VLTRATRDLAGGRHALHERLEGLRTLGASSSGIELPDLVELRRFSPAGLVLGLGTLVALGVFLSDVGDPSQVWHVVRHAHWSWITVALVLSFASNVGFALGLQGTVPIALPMWPTTELQVAMSYSNLAVPGVGGLGMQVRFLQRLGVDLPSALAAGGILSSVGSLAAALVLFALALAFDPTHVDLGLLPTSGLTELTVIVGAIVAISSVLVLGIGRL